MKSGAESGPGLIQEVLPGRTGDQAGDYLQHRFNHKTGLEIRLCQQCNKISASKSRQQDKRPRTRLPTVWFRLRARARPEVEPLGPQAEVWMWPPGEVGQGN